VTPNKARRPSPTRPSTTVFTPVVHPTRPPKTTNNHIYQKSSYCGVKAFSYDLNFVCVNIIPCVVVRYTCYVTVTRFICSNQVSALNLVVGWLVGCLVGSFVGRLLFGWLVACLLAWSVGWLVGRLVGLLVGWLVAWLLDLSVSWLVS